MSGQHATLAPSSAPQWGNCSGSMLANMNAPDLDSEESLKGEAVHWVGEDCLRKWKDPDGGAHSCFEWVGSKAPNGVVIDEEMAEGAQVFVDDVLSVAQEHGALRNMLIEHRVAMPQIHALNWGTLDCCIPVMDKGLIYLWDYKNGHRENRAKGNLQLINYTAGMINDLNIDGKADQHIRVILRIVQPFCYKTQGPVDEWSFMLSDLRPYFNQLHAKAHEAMTNPTMSTGEWCRDCAAIRTCSAARRANYNLIDYVNEPYEMDAMDGATLAVERKILMCGLVSAKARLEAIEDDLHHRITGGAIDTGLALQSKSGNLAWSIPPEQAIALASQFQGDIAKNAVLTPTQAKSRVPSELRGQFEQVLKTVTRRPSGGLKLIDADDTIGARAFKRK